MALKIKKTLDTGIDVEYWRIKSIVCDTEEGTNVYCFGYLNQAARGADKKNIEQNSFTVPIDPKTYDKKMIDACYVELKKLDFFSGSTDI